MLGWHRQAASLLLDAETELGALEADGTAAADAAEQQRLRAARLLGDHSLTWQPRTNRALLVDRHDQRTRLIVPFVRLGRHDEFEEAGLP